MLSKFFISRPIFAIVLAIVTMVFGLFALISLPVERYPDIAPPRISVSANYTGASAETVEQSVTQVLEQQIKGIDHLLYFSSSSDSSGRSRINIHFELGTDPDQAQVQVQNRISNVISRLPEDVQRQGVNVAKSLSDTHMVVGLYDQTGQSNNIELSDYLINHFEQVISRVEGVGEVDVFGSQYAMRIWLDPQKLKQYQLMPSDVRSAIEAQNTQVAAGSIGALPATEEQYLNAKVTSGSKLHSVEQFNQIILKANQNGGFVLLQDVARVELGAENYQSFNTLNGYPSAGLGVSLASGANAVKTAEQIELEVEKLKTKLPNGYTVVYPRDNTPFVKESIQQVIATLIEAIILVVVVMFLFLQNWRATLIPTVTVPVVILGTFAVLYVLGMTINTLTLFALVLAIGLLVDDAIVVVENVERLMHEQQVSAVEASIVSMKEISGALVGITLVLTAVFIPMAFFSGSTGVIYRQFAITLVAAMTISLLVALTLTPALCALGLKKAQQQRRWAVYFNQGIASLSRQYLRLTQFLIAQRWLSIAVFLGVSVLAIGMYRALPTSFLPTEDQGMLNLQFKLPDGAPMRETAEVGREISNYFLTHEKEHLNAILVIHGRNFSGTGQNLGQSFISFKHWDERDAADASVAAIQKRAMAYFKQHPKANIMVMMPPSVRGLGNSNGVQFWVQDSIGAGKQFLNAKHLQLVEQAKAFQSFYNLDKKTNNDKAELKVDIDQRRAMAAGLNQSAINSTLAAAWGGSYINDFIDRGRIKRVYMQGDAPYRSTPEDLSQWHVRNASGQMISFDNFSSVSWAGGPEVVERFMGVSGTEMEAELAAGASSGQAMQDIERMLDEHQDVTLAWSGLSYQEMKSSDQAIWLYLLSIGFVFLCLAALYESWSIPTAVLITLPLAICGTILFTYFRGFPNDIYFQIALLTTVGLSSKNAILIVEFAAEAQARGKSVVDAAIEGAKLRMRPILMTSLAFGAGILPLVFATGAGALSRQEIGISVLGGVVFGTILVPLFTPFMYVLIRSVFKGKQTHGKT